MEKKRLKALALVAPLCLTMATTTPQASAAVNTIATADYAVEYLEPRYEHLTRISSGLTISGIGRANCGGSFTTFDSYDSRMEMSLQQYVDSEWKEIKSWTEDFTGSGVKMMEKGYYVSSGYRYRMVVTVEILDSDGDVIEKVTCDSPIKEY